MQDWQTLRNHFIRQTGGDLPGGNLEQELIDRYAEHPDTVERSVEKIIAGHKAGKIRSPWGALKTEVARAVIPANNPSHDEAHTRQQKIARAEQWIRTAGLHYDRPSEIEHELFGDTRVHPETDKDGQPIPPSGQPPLTAYQDDNPLRNRLLEHWAKHRPVGERTEQDAIDRGLRHQAERAALAPIRKPESQTDRPLEIKDGIRIP